MKTAIVTGALFASCALLASFVPSFAVAQDPVVPPADVAECPNRIPHEPLVLYEVNGATLSGVIDRTLTVYSDGFLKLAYTVPGEAGRSASAVIAPDLAGDLLEALSAAGALQLCDDEPVHVDLPLHTVTLMRGAHDMRGRTFSYWNTEAGYAQVDAVLEGFVATHFPGF